jgi:hypothetical protein
MGMKPLSSLPVLVAALLVATAAARADQAGRRHAENELHARPAVRITVGQTEGDLIGRDNRALQAAVDYVAGLGGGVVEIGPGEYRSRIRPVLRSGAACMWRPKSNSTSTGSAPPCSTGAVITSP